MSTASKPVRAALYARVSTDQQTTNNQLLELRDYAQRQAWTDTEFVDQGVSGAKASRPALDRLMTEAKQRRFDVVVVWRLDRFGRSVQHIVTALNELQARGVTFVSIGEGIDLSTPSGKLQLHILAALAEFERARIQERIYAGLARARAQGKQLGRKPHIHPKSAGHTLATDANVPSSDAARRLGVSKETINRLRRRARKAADTESPAANTAARADSATVF